MQAVGEDHDYASQEEDTENKENEKRENFAPNALRHETPREELSHCHFHPGSFCSQKLGHVPVAGG